MAGENRRLNPVSPSVDRWSQTNSEGGGTGAVRLGTFLTDGWRRWTVEEIEIPASFPRAPHAAVAAAWLDRGRLDAAEFVTGG